MNRWRSLHGPGRTVFFNQEHHPGRLAASDFTVCNELGVKIAGQRFEHTFFHCVLTYSNVESVSLCFSESFESLSAGIQKAFWEFGGVPQRHRSDSLAAAVRNHTSRRELTERYAALMSYYNCEAERTNARCANENGDVESSNGHLKDRIDQALLLRGSRSFDSREEYVDFVEGLVKRANDNRRKNFLDDLAHLNRLPDERLDTDDIIKGVRVSRSSTINVRTNTYSVPSRLIGQLVDLRIGAEQITVTHYGHLIQTMPRLVGKQLAAINYRHIIDSLVRKPGAFANYRYREEMFPTSGFRMAWDSLRAVHSEKVADKMYVQILQLAAQESQDAVADALRHLLATEHTLDVERVRELVSNATSVPAPSRLNKAHRKADFRKGKRLGKGDHIVRWRKPTTIRSLNWKDYHALPDYLTIRETRIRVDQPGFRTKSIVVVTTLLDPEKTTREDLAALYRARWNQELDLRSIKSTMQMDVLRCKTPELVHKEVWTHILAYNLIRTIMAQAACRHDIEPRTISFKGTLQTLKAFQPLIAIQSHRDTDFRMQLFRQLLNAIVCHRVADRPDRFEPRMKKQRHKKVEWMVKPRWELKREMAKRVSKN